MFSTLRARFTARRPAKAPPLPAAAGLIVITLTALYNLGFVVAAANGGRLSDFQEYWVAARLGLRRGWAAVYDGHLYTPLLVQTGGNSDTYPATLVQAWLAIPLAWLPLPVAYGCWVVVLFCLLVLSWRLVVSGSWHYRVAMLMAAFATEPGWFLLTLGQITGVAFAALAATYAALMRRRELLAGLLLIGILTKPQDAFLVPVALLLLGRRRTFTVFAAGSAVIAAVMLVMVGGLHGVALWHASVSFELARPAIREYTLPEHLPAVLVWPARAAVLAAFALAVRRHGPARIEPVLAASVLASMLVTPYLNKEDLELLVLLAWLTLPAATALGRVGLLVAFIIGATGCWAVPSIVVELTWLSALATGWPAQLDAWGSERLRGWRPGRPALGAGATG